MTTYRHRPLHLLPLALLAIALQVFLPVIAMRSVAAAADPLGHMAICSTDPGNAGPADDGPAHGQHAHCPLCQIAASASATLVAGPVSVPRPVGVSTAVVADPAESAGPRGPPEYRHRARGPPRLS